MSRCLMVAALLLAALAPAVGYGQESAGGTILEGYLSPEMLEMVFPDAERYGEIEGDPPAAAVYRGGELVGYVFEAHDVVQAVGFSGKPFHMMVGLGLDGRVRGVRLTRHSEPISILARTDDDFHAYLTQFPGIDVRNGVSVVLASSAAVFQGRKFAQRPSAAHGGDMVEVDALSRTTTSSVLFSDAIVRAARQVARARGLLGAHASGGRVLDLRFFEASDWPAMVADGAIGRLHLTHGKAARAFAEKSAAPPSGVHAGKEDETLLDLYMALVSPAGIGLNILGRTWYDQYMAGRGVKDLLLVIAASGADKVLARDLTEDGTFRRIQLVQGERTIPLRKEMVKVLPFLHAKNGPSFGEIGLFFLTEAAGLDPVEPWRLELIIEGGDEVPALVNFSMPYKVPERFIERLPTREISTLAADSGVAWRGVWRQHSVRIGVLGASLAALVVILSLQDAIARRPRLHTAVRIGFLSWTLVWIGWYAGAQLTIVNLLTLAQALVEGLQWDVFLVDPLIFVIMAFVALAMFLWGRAIFCGWLCPFGALQELLNRAARALKVTQITLPAVLHERLIAVKYLIFLGLLGVSFYSFDLAIAGTAVEPFKTAITFRFDAPWAPVAYALALLGAGLFVERFYCRFVCPLGAGLSILGRVRMFNWLKRRPQCGSQCRICESVCPVGAIKRSGEIDLNECFYCLDCQVTYYDDHRCPPLIARRKRGEARTRQGSAPVDPAVAAETVRRSAE